MTATKNDAIATPVITPGRMIGSVTPKLTACPPRKRWRANANAIIVPSTIAIAGRDQADPHRQQRGVPGLGVVRELVEPARREARGRASELMLVLLKA